MITIIKLRLILLTIFLGGELVLIGVPLAFEIKKFDTNNVMLSPSEITDIVFLIHLWGSIILGLSFLFGVIFSFRNKKALSFLFVESFLTNFYFFVSIYLAVLITRKFVFDSVDDFLFEMIGVLVVLGIISIKIAYRKLIRLEELNPTI
ncbi:hypothetical protein [Aliikangiella sp. IMCC44632]